jgi:hypothetical protein
MMRDRTRRALLQGVKATAWVTDRLRAPKRGVVVLLYHRIGGGSRLEMDLPVGLFIRQLELLSQMDVIGLSEAVAVLTSRGDGDAADRQPVVVSFDDGTADFVDTALPLLVRYRIPATLYLATRFVEERKIFPHGGAPLSWGAIRDAISTGLVTVGSHTHSHLLLDHAGPPEVETDLRRSTQLIGERLDVSAEHFAYPKARLPRDHIETIVRQLFGSAAVGGNRANVPGHTDVHRLARSPIQASDGMRWFGAKLSGGLALEERLRGRFRGARYVSSSF